MGKLLENFLCLLKGEKVEAEKTKCVEDDKTKITITTAAGQLKKSAPIPIPKKMQPVGFKKIYEVPNEKEVGDLWEMHASIQRVARLNCQPGYPYPLSDYSIYEMQHPE